MTISLTHYLVVRQDVLACMGLRPEERDYFRLAAWCGWDWSETRHWALFPCFPQMPSAGRYFTNKPEVFSPCTGRWQKDSPENPASAPGPHASGPWSGAAWLQLAMWIPKSLNALTALGYSVVEAQAAVQIHPA